MFFIVLWLDLPSVSLDVHFSFMLYKVSTETFHNWYTPSRKVSSAETTGSEQRYVYKISSRNPRTYRF